MRRTRTRSTRKRLRAFLLGSLLVVATFLVYQPAWDGDFIWDDDVYVVENELLTAPDGLRRIWFSLDQPSQYFPLVYTTFRFERALWGLNTTGYHIVNILLHAASALLIWRLLVRLRVPGALFAAAIFALHPVHVESVAWITERKNVLMGVFFLLALLAWVRFVDEQTQHPWRYYVLALMLYALALFSKTTACTLPAALLLILWLQKKPINWKRIVHVAPFVVLGLVMGLVAMWWERHKQGTHGDLFSLDPLERLLVACRGVWFYLYKLVWPAKLTFTYPRWEISSADPFDYVWLAALIALCMLIWFGRRYFGRGPEIAAAFYVANLSPMLGFVMLYTFRYTFVADHYQYAASIGPIALISAATTRFFSRKGVSAKARIGFSVLPLLALGALTWQQAGVYRNLETLWRDTLAKNPASWMAHDNLGVVLNERGEYEEAKTHFRKALELNPDNPIAHNNLGAAFLNQGRPEEAQTHLLEALQIEPSYPDAYTNLGAALAAQGKIDEAVESYRRALDLKPDQPTAHNNLSAALAGQQKFDEAVAHLRQALRYKPDYPEARNNLGSVFASQEKFEEAAREYAEAIRLNPHYAEAHLNLGRVLLQLGRREQAVQHLREAFRLNHPGAEEELRKLEAP